MSTPFHILPAPSSIRLIPERQRPIVTTVLSPWPAPAASTVKRSNAWPAPLHHTTVWAPPVAPVLDIDETVTVRGRRRRPWYRKIGVRTAVGTLGASAAAIAIALALISQL